MQAQYKTTFEYVNRRAVRHDLPLKERERGVVANISLMLRKTPQEHLLTLRPNNRPQNKGTMTTMILRCKTGGGKPKWANRGGVVRFGIESQEPSCAAKIAANSMLSNYNARKDG